MRTKTPTDQDHHSDKARLAVALIIGFFLALIVGEFVDFNISSILGVSENSVSGAAILGSAVVFSAVFVSYFGLLASKYSALGALLSDLERARRRIDSGLESVEKIRRHRSARLDQR